MTRCGVSPSFRSAGAGHAGGWPGGGLFLALLFVWAIKRALIDPFNLACLLQAFLRRTAGQAPDPGWVARMERDSPEFLELSATHGMG